MVRLSELLVLLLLSAIFAAFIFDRHPPSPVIVNLPPITVSPTGVQSTWHEPMFPNVTSVTKTKHVPLPTRKPMRAIAAARRGSEGARQKKPLAHHTHIQPWHTVVCKPPMWPWELPCP
jgi:hypothetical protein